MPFPIFIMTQKIGIGLLGLGTVGTGVANIIHSPLERHPLVSEIELKRIAVRDLKAGQILSKNVICWKNPGTGILPKDSHLVLNKILKRDIFRYLTFYFRAISNIPSN